MKKYLKTIIISIIMLFAITIGVNAQSWYTSGYNWARSMGLIGSKTTQQLGENVDLVEFYGIFFKYLDQKGGYITNIFTKSDDYKQDNYALVATDRRLTALAAKEWLTNNEYKTAKTLIEKGHKLIERNEKYFTDTQIKNIEYYLDVMNYILYQKIYDYEFKITQSVKKPEHADRFMEYKLLPLYGEVTREEFLTLMYHRMVDPTETNIGKIINTYKDSGVLLGYDNNLMLTVRLNYAHLTTFLSRM